MTACHCSDQRAASANSCALQPKQVGGAIGLALLTAVSTARTDTLLERLGAGGATDSDGFGGGAALPPPVAAAINDGWDLGFVVGAGLLAAAAALMWSLVRVDKDAAAAALKEVSAAA